MILGHAGMVPGGALGRSGLYWAVLGCPGVAVRQRTLALRCGEKLLIQLECTGTYWDGNGRCWDAQKWHWDALRRAQE